MISGLLVDEEIIAIDGLSENMSYDPKGIALDRAFFRLWGADGNKLVVQRQGDGWGLSWARVSASPSTPLITGQLVLAEFPLLP